MPGTLVSYLKYANQEKQPFKGLVGIMSLILYEKFLYMQVTTGMQLMAVNEVKLQKL
jgi:Ca2+/H+ antiporter